MNKFNFYYVLVTLIIDHIFFKPILYFYNITTIEFELINLKQNWFVNSVHNQQLKIKKFNSLIFLTFIFFEI